MAASMEQGIRMSRCIVALLPSDYAQSHNCLCELKWAPKIGKVAIFCLADHDRTWELNAALPSCSKCSKLSDPPCGGHISRFASLDMTACSNMPDFRPFAIPSQFDALTEKWLAHPEMEPAMVTALKTDTNALPRLMARIQKGPNSPAPPLQQH